MATTHQVFKFVKDNIGQFEIGGKSIAEGGRVGSLLQALSNDDILVRVGVYGGHVRIRSGAMAPAVCKLNLGKFVKRGLWSSVPRMIGNQRYYILTKAQREELHDIVGMLAI